MYLWRLKRRVHTSWLIACASAGVIVGAACVPLVDQTWFASGVWLLVAMLLGGLVLWRRSLYLVPLIIIVGVLIGLWRGSIEQSQRVVYETLRGASASVTGRLYEDADTGKSGELVLRIDHLVIQGHAVTGKMWASTSTNADIKRGDRVTVQGKVSEGFGSFAAVVYRAKLVNVVRPVPGDVARQVRDWFADATRLAIAEPQASLGLGFLVGQRRGLPEELSQALVIAGLTHIVVASGYNLTILVRLTRRLFARVSKYLATLSASMMIGGFLAVTGASPSMTRASLVAGLSLAAWYYGRKFHPLVLLPFAAAITVLIDPSYVWGDLGWQLSFAAFAGVMIVAPLVQAFFFGPEKPGTIRQILGETISAQLVTLPILVLAFGQFSNVALIANLLILPLVPLAMLLTFIAGISALVVPAIAPLLGWPAQILLAYMTTVADYLAKLPWAQGEVEINVWVVIVSYVAIVAACVYMWYKTRHDLRENNIIE